MAEYSQENKEFKEALTKKWHTKGIPAVPLFLNAVAWSGFKMKEPLGFNYTNFLLHYKEGYCEFNYLQSDLDKIWLLLGSKMRREPEYLKDCKTEYEKTFQKLEQDFKDSTNLRLRDMGDIGILTAFQKALNLQINSVGVSHLIEPIALDLEQGFKEQLFEELREKNDFVYYYTHLTMPSQQLFSDKEEADLRSIFALPQNKRERPLKEHIENYRWLQNTYEGPGKLTVKELEERLEYFRKAQYEKKEILSVRKPSEPFTPSPKLQKMIETIDFITIWQDERKENTLKTIGYFTNVIDEVSSRIGVEPKIIYYLGTSEALSLNSIKDIKPLENELKLRQNGVFFLQGTGKEFRAIGDLYNELSLIYHKSVQIEGRPGQEIHGTSANTGTAIGKVAVCKDASSISKVTQGDVLVFSMTKPEFVPALKKAEGIVTDEGGIACYAAIAARELKIPAVIGTKMASKILKDGMLVEVKANQGVVKIIE